MSTTSLPGVYLVFSDARFISDIGHISTQNKLFGQKIGFYHARAEFIEYISNSSKYERFHSQISGA